MGAIGSTPEVGVSAGGASQRSRAAMVGGLGRPALGCAHMPDPKLEEVFKTSGLPTFTFVQPVEYSQLLIAIRTAGRGVVIEGPSGIGKTTAVEKALDELGKSGEV